MANDRPIVWDFENADHRRAFATALAPLVSVLWKKKEPFGVVEARTYMRTLKHVPSPILVEAVEKALEVERWFPEPAKLLDFAAELITVKRREAQVKWLTDCEQCHGARWVPVVVDGRTYETRCDCWKRMRIALEEIGQPIDRPKQLTEGAHGDVA